MQPSQQVEPLVAQMPDVDGRGMYTENIDDQKIHAVIEQLHAGGRESVLGVIDLLLPPGEGEDYKARYALHCLAIHVCKLPDDRPRREFAEILASQLGCERPASVQKYLVEQLQGVAGREAAEKLGLLLGHEALCEPAAMALAAIGVAEPLRQALPEASSSCRLTILQVLASMADTESNPAFRAALDDADGAVRLAGALGLAKTGDAGSLDRLLKLAQARDIGERDLAVSAVLLLAENLAAAGKRAEALQVYRRLLETHTDDSDRHHRLAAQRGLLALESQ